VGEKVAELARLPWVLERTALNPVRVSRRVRMAAPVILHKVRRPNRRSPSGTRAIIASQS
jgi:hypothetical protein